MTNLQGDVVAIVNAVGNTRVEYTYDAWGNILSITGSYADTIGKLNPLRYRGYVYDQPTQLYYLQSRYYAPNLGRFISADVYTSTGQGLLGYNMFAYCVNNPINGCDPCGTCMHYWYLLGLKDCDVCREKTASEKWQDYFDNGITATFTTGGFISANLGIFNVSGSVEIACDLKGNIQVVASGSFDVSTSGSFSVSAGTTKSAFLMPDTSYLAGDTYYLGGGAYVPMPGTPVAVGAGGNIGCTSDGYWGAMTTTGIAPLSTAGGEFHSGYAKTVAITERFNVFDWFLNLLR